MRPDLAGNGIGIRNGTVDGRLAIRIIQVAGHGPVHIWSGFYFLRKSMRVKRS